MYPLKIKSISRNKWMQKVWHICIMEYYSPTRKEILLFATSWTELEGIMLNEVGQTEKDKYSMVPHKCGTK